MDIEFNDTFEKRFFSKVDRTDDCWNWTAYRNGKGYGYIGNGRGKMVSAHRAAWVWYNGKQIPDGLHVLHTCDNPGCVRFDHLKLGNHAENMKQKMDRGRAASRVVFHVKEVELLRNAVANGMPKVEVSRRTGVDYNTLLRILSPTYVGREPITLEKLDDTGEVQR